MTMILYLTKDLMLASNVKATAERSGIELKIVPSVERLVESIGQVENVVGKVIVDLQTPGLGSDDFGSIVAASKSSATPPTVIGYAQHVHTDLLEGAGAAGFDTVLTRGQMHNGVEQILAS